MCGRIGEEARAALGPGRLASRVVLGLIGDELAALQFFGERIGPCRRIDGARLGAPRRAEVQRGGYDRDGDQSEPERARDRPQIEKSGPHQWNIWAEPG